MSAAYKKYLIPTERCPYIIRARGVTCPMLVLQWLPKVLALDLNYECFLLEIRDSVRTNCLDNSLICIVHLSGQKGWTIGQFRKEKKN